MSTGGNIPGRTGRFRAALRGALRCGIRPATLLAFLPGPSPAGAAPEVRPDGGAAAVEAKPHWSLTPLVPPAPPGGEANPIDAYIRARLRDGPLGPSPEADRRTLLRRLSYDLAGLPPTPQEVAAFIHDKDPEAYEAAVARLLASPRYGEHWARHWLDAANYADTHGNDHDYARPNAWPYRDYVIGAFNDDKPYARFVQEQVAGDALFPDDPQATVALGFLAAGPWDHTLMVTVREDTVDHRSAQNLDRDSMVSTAMGTFQSLTVHCARCHNHKFDPVTQREYYALQAVFAGVDRADRPFDRDAATQAERRRLSAAKRAMEQREAALMASLESPEVGRKVAAWEQARGKREQVWLPFEISFTLLLEFHDGVPGHGIGRFRLSACNDVPAGAILKPLSPAVAAVLRVPAGERTAVQRRGLAMAVLMAENEEALAALPVPQQVYAVTRDFPPDGENFKPSPQPRPIHLLIRGDLGKPAELVGPGTLGCVPGMPSALAIADAGDESARRAALARWLSGHGNVLTWRSIVNRVWHYHFGRGLCDTPNDFGKMGGWPSHPELLDWLAVWFRDEAQGSLKQLHRLILTSKTWKQTSLARQGTATDPDNRLLWRQNRPRLSGEAVRDTLLALGGRLDLTMGGPSVVQFVSRGDATFNAGGNPAFLDYELFDPDAPAARRRAIYRFLFRTVPDPFMDALDCPDGSTFTPVRSVSTTAVQALAMLNNAFLIRQCGHIAARLEAQAGTPEALAEAAFQLILLRSAREDERAKFSAYIQAHGAANACQWLLNSNEFLHLD